MGLAKDTPPTRHTADSEPSREQLEWIWPILLVSDLFGPSLLECIGAGAGTDLGQPGAIINLINQVQPLKLLQALWGS